MPTAPQFLLWAYPFPTHRSFLTPQVWSPPAQHSFFVLNLSWCHACTCVLGIQSEIYFEICWK
jgi:hypothetical protein